MFTGLAPRGWFQSHRRSIDVMIISLHGAAWIPIQAVPCRMVMIMSSIVRAVDATGPRGVSSDHKPGVDPISYFWICSIPSDWRIEIDTPIRGYRSSSCFVPFRLLTAL